MQTPMKWFKMEFFNAAATGYISASQLMFYVKYVWPRSALALQQPTQLTTHAYTFLKEGTLLLLPFWAQNPLIWDFDSVLSEGVSECLSEDSAKIKDHCLKYANVSGAKLVYACSEQKNRAPSLRNSNMM